MLNCRDQIEQFMTLLHSKGDPSLVAVAKVSKQAAGAASKQLISMVREHLMAKLVNFTKHLSSNHGYLINDKVMHSCEGLQNLHVVDALLPCPCTRHWLVYIGGSGECGPKCSMLPHQLVLLHALCLEEEV